MPLKASFCPLPSLSLSLSLSLSSLCLVTARFDFQSFSGRASHGQSFVPIGNFLPCPSRRFQFADCETCERPISSRDTQNWIFFSSFRQFLFYRGSTATILRRIVEYVCIYSFYRDEYRTGVLHGLGIKRRSINFFFFTSSCFSRNMYFCFCIRAHLKFT